MCVASVAGPWWSLRDTHLPHWLSSFVTRGRWPCIPGWQLVLEVPGLSVSLGPGLSWLSLSLPIMSRTLTPAPFSPALLSGLLSVSFDNFAVILPDSWAPLIYTSFIFIWNLANNKWTIVGSISSKSALFLYDKNNESLSVLSESHGLIGLRLIWKVSFIPIWAVFPKPWRLLYAVIKHFAARSVSCKVF